MNGADCVLVKANVSIANVKGAVAPGCNQNVVKAITGIL